jgi:hypothetical protein
VSPYELQRRIAGASSSLRIQLEAWDDLKSSNHVGIELILPSLLEYLEQEDSALKFEFKEHTLLQEMRAAKLLRFNSESMYRKTPLSTIYSLEAFIGKIDFDRVKHQLFQDSMMASPSSTVAYLTNASQWDEEAEAYLQHIVEAGSGFGNGGIQGTFPTTYFEYSWVSNLLPSSSSWANIVHRFLPRSSAPDSQHLTWSALNCTALKIFSPTQLTRETESSVMVNKPLATHLNENFH